MALQSLPRMYDLDEVAELARRTPKAVRQLRARQLAGERVGPRFRKIDGRVLVAEDDLAAWLAGDNDQTNK